MEKNWSAFGFSEFSLPRPWKGVWREAKIFIVSMTYPHLPASHLDLLSTSIGIKAEDRSNPDSKIGLIRYSLSLSLILFQSPSPSFYFYNWTSSLPFQITINESLWHHIQSSLIPSPHIPHVAHLWNPPSKWLHHPSCISGSSNNQIQPLTSITETIGPQIPAIQNPLNPNQPNPHRNPNPNTAWTQT